MKNFAGLLLVPFALQIGSSPQGVTTSSLRPEGIVTKQLAPGACAPLPGIGTSGAAQLCNNGVATIEYTLDTTGALSVDLGNGGSATATGLQGANVEIHGSGSSVLSIFGHQNKILDRMGGAPISGTLQVHGNLNEIRFGAPDGKLTTVKVFATNPPSEPVKISYQGNLFPAPEQPEPGNVIQVMAYQTNGTSYVFYTVQS